MKDERDRVDVKKQGEDYLYKKTITVSSTCHGKADGATHMTTQITAFTPRIFTTRLQNTELKDSGLWT